MRRVISWLLAGLPFDARSRRAIDETLLDWEGEATEAQTLTEATVTEVRGVASIARVTSMSLLRESIDFSWLRGLGRRFAVAGAAVVGLAVLLALFAGEVMGHARSMLWFVPMLARLALPAALFLIIAWRPSGHHVPSFGASWVTSIAAVLAIQVVVVLAGEMFYFLMFRDLGVVGLGQPAARASVWLQPGIWLGVAGFSAVVASVMVLAANLAKRSGLHSRWWLVGIPVLSLIMPAGVQIAMRLTLLTLGLPEYRVFADLVLAFTFAAVLLVLAAKFGSRETPTREGNA